MVGAPPFRPQQLVVSAVIPEDRLQNQRPVPDSIGPLERWKGARSEPPEGRGGLQTWPQGRAREVTRCPGQPGCVFRRGGVGAVGSGSSSPSTPKHREQIPIRDCLRTIKGFQTVSSRVLTGTLPCPSFSSLKILIFNRKSISVP